MNYATLIDIVARDAALPMEQAFLLRSQLTSGLRKIATLVDEMQLLMGGRGIASDGPLTAVWLDMMAARAHAGNDPSAVYAQLAGQMLDAE